MLAETTLTFPTGSERGARQCVDVSIVDDIAVENTESFVVQLTTNNPNIELSSICNRASFTIYDSDGEKEYSVILYSMTCDALKKDVY